MYLAWPDRIFDQQVWKLSSQKNPTETLLKQYLTVFKPGLLVYVLIYVYFRTYQWCLLPLIISSFLCNITVWAFVMNIVTLKTLQILILNIARANRGPPSLSVISRIYSKVPWFLPQICAFHDLDGLLPNCEMQHRSEASTVRQFTWTRLLCSSFPISRYVPSTGRWSPQISTYQTH